MDTLIQQQTAARAAELPGAELVHPFGPDADVYKVRGKVFMIQMLVKGEPLVVLKATPADSTTLRTGFTGISPGYHMNKKHWITLHPDCDLGQQLIEDLVTDSYLLVIEHSVPKSRWPVDPHTFGQQHQQDQ